jgi:tetratricopeptide (TPR) repeat protein
MQEQGISMMLESGETPADKVGMFNYYLGKWAMDAKDYARARAAFQASAAAGYADGDPEVIQAETYFGEKNYAQGLRYLADLIDKRKAAGQQIPDAWLHRGLAMAYEAKLTAEGNDYAKRLLANNINNDNWLRAFTVVATLNKLDEASQLDLLRLMMATDALKEKYQYQEYLNNTIKAGLPNETLAVLKYGVGKGAFAQTDPIYLSSKELVDPIAARDVKDAPNMAKDARAAATGKEANGAGNAYYSLGQYADAEAMFTLALEKGGVDADLVRTRLGMAQVQQGKYAEAKTTFEAVSGARVPVAAMWAAYANSKATAG